MKFVKPLLLLLTIIYSIATKGRGNKNSNRYNDFKKKKVGNLPIIESAR